MSSSNARIRIAQLSSTLWLGGGEVQFVELLKGLLSSYEIQVAVIEHAGPLTQTVRQIGLVPAVFPLKGTLLQPNSLLQVGRMARWLKTHRIDLVHAHDLYTTLLAVPAAKIAGCRVVVGRLDLVHWDGKMLGAALTLASRAADQIIANASAIRAMLVDRERIPPEKISLIYNGIDLPSFDARARQGPNAPLPETGSAPVAVLVANMAHAVKRQEDFLHALALARKDFPALQAFLIGDGARRSELETLATGLGLRGTAHFLGHRTDVPAVIARARLGVLCSSKEGLSNAIMEGMASRLPMVVTDAGGNTELVKHGERGFVVDVERPIDLANAMVRLLDNPDLARKLGEAGRSFVERELSLERMLDAHDALYRRLTLRQASG